MEISIDSIYYKLFFFYAYDFKKGRMEVLSLWGLSNFLTL